MKRLLIRSGRAPFKVFSAEEAIERNVMAGNAGNLIFSDAAHKLLAVPGVTVESNGTGIRRQLAEQLDERYDAFVVPLANAFRPGFAGSLQRLTDVIRRTSKPVVVLGVGAQAGVTGDYTELAPLDDTVRAFVAAVLDRGPTIGVRGEFTAGYLARLGFRDVEVIGCPSMFLNGPEFALAKRVGTIDGSSPISLNGSHAVISYFQLDTLIRRTADRFERSVFIGQNTVEVLQLRWWDVSSNVGGMTSMPTHPEHPMFRAGRARFYVDPVTWIDDLRGFDFSLGTRIHGSIAALLAGTPAVVLCGDSRTLELCRYFGIPHRVLGQPGNEPDDLDPIRLHEEADYTALIDGHRERWDRLVSFLDSHGLQNAFTHGVGGAEFDARLASLDFAPAVRPSTESDLAAARAHVAWLREHARGLRAKAGRRQRPAVAAKRAPQRGSRLRRGMKRSR